jgi:putative restriction endonuclease
MIERYLHAFSKLRVDVSPNRWPGETFHRAPHKPFLLLSVIDLIAQGEIQRNFIELNNELIDTFNLYWVKIMGKERNCNPVLPFYHLKSDGFWHLISVPGMEQVLAHVGQIKSISQLQQLILGAKLEDPLFQLLLNDETREKLRCVLIKTYFAPEVRPTVVEVGKITAESIQYSHELSKHTQRPFELQDVPMTQDHYQSESRSIAFRRIIVDAYNHKCAICGIRIITPEGRTAVVAAHIVPWSISRNDDPRNGMALCGLHHWTFDQGLIGVASEYQIKISPVIPQDDKATGPLLTLAETKINLPADINYHPAKKALQWHMKEIFRKGLNSKLL